MKSPAELLYGDTIQSTTMGENHEIQYEDRWRYMKKFTDGAYEVRNRGNFASTTLAVDLASCNFDQFCLVRDP